MRYGRIPLALSGPSGSFQRGQPGFTHDPRNPAPLGAGDDRPLPARQRALVRRFGTENTTLCDLLVEKGVFTRLNPAKRPNSFLARSAPSDVARVEDRTYICTRARTTPAPPTTGLIPRAMKRPAHRQVRGCMKGRTMYVIPFCMGPLDSPAGQDRRRNHRQRLRRRQHADHDPHGPACAPPPRRRSGRQSAAPRDGHGTFIPCLHSIGAPLEPGKPTSWPCNNDKYICHFPETREIWSFGSGYGGNALLGKKCLALRIASCIARDNGWMAEHMLLLGIHSPNGEKTYVAPPSPRPAARPTWP
jgi:phosphoenolpyruvate carboxykinase (GTP)